MVSCVILNYNDAERTIRLTEIICTYNCIDYIILVDNQSTDDSAEKLTAIQNNKIIFITSDKNGGYGYGNNIGVKYGQEILHTDYTIIANPDVFFDQETAKEMINALKEDPEALITAPMQTRDGIHFIENVAWKTPTIMSYTTNTLYFLRNRFRQTPYDKRQLTLFPRYKVDCVPGALLAINNSLFCKIGGYDERMFLYGEETCLGIKCKNTGYHALLLTGHKYTHYHKEETKPTINKIIRHNRIYLQSKKVILRYYLNASAIQMIFLWICHFISTLEIICNSLITRIRINNKPED